MFFPMLIFHKSQEETRNLHEKSGMEVTKSPLGTAYLVIWLIVGTTDKNQNVPGLNSELVKQKRKQSAQT